MTNATLFGFLKKYIYILFNKYRLKIITQLHSNVLISHQAKRKKYCKFDPEQYVRVKTFRNIVGFFTFNINHLNHLIPMFYVTKDNYMI